MVEEQQNHRLSFQVQRCRYQFDWLDFQLKIRETQHRLELMSGELRAL